MVFPVLFFRIISAPEFVNEIEENPIFEIFPGKKIWASSFVKITKLFGSILDSGKILFETSSDAEYLKHNPNRRCPDIEKARKILGYKPNVTLRDGIYRYFRFLRDSA